MKITRNYRAFTLFELMAAIGSLSIVMSVAYVGISEMKASIKAQKLEQDVSVINTAVQMYVAHGGRIGTLTSPQSIIDKLKTVPTTENRKQIAGLRDSMVDPRLEVVMQKVQDAESGDPRALWNAAQKRFVVVRDGDPGIKSFRMNRARMLSSPVFDEDRVVSLKLAKNTNWVWDYIDTDNGNPNSFGPVNVGSTATVPFGLPNTPPGPLSLNPPAFSPEGGNFPLVDFEAFEVSISDPNPPGSSQLIFTLDGQNWQLYEGETFLVEPSDTIQAIAVTLDPDVFADSGIYSATYAAIPVQLGIDVDVPQNPISYPQAGGAMVPGDIPAPSPVGPISVALTNGDEIPSRYQNSDEFNIFWSFDGSSPLAEGATGGGEFSEGFPGVTIDYSLSAWGASDSLQLEVAAKSLNSEILAHSELESTEINIDKIALRSLTSDLSDDGFYTADQEMSFLPVSAFGDLPEGWRIYYTTDGSDPGYNDAGEPVGGNLYTGAFELFPGSGVTTNVGARLYGPSGYGHWFTPSQLYSASFTRWVVPEWHGYIGGAFANISYSSFRNIKQHQTDGPLDLTFNPGDGLNGIGHCVVLQPDGRAVVGGAFTTADGIPRNRVVRFNVDGSVDLSFDPGAGADNTVMAVAMQPDGKILVGGIFQNFGGHVRKGLVRLHADGSVDESFDPGDAVHSDAGGWVRAIEFWPGAGALGAGSVVDPGVVLPPAEPRILIGGHFSEYDSNEARSLARLNLDGSYDAAFDTSVGVGGYLNDIELQSNGYLVIGGSFPHYDGLFSKNVARVLPDGHVDPVFKVKVGNGANKDVNTITLYPDDSENAGKIFIGGNFNDVDKQQRKNVARLNHDGGLDNTFQIEFSNGEGQAVPSWIVRSSALTSDERVIVGGNLIAYNDQAGARSAFVRLKTYGAIDPTYTPEELPQHSAVNDIALRGDDRALIVGSFDEAATAIGGNIAKLDPATGALDGAFDVGSGANGDVHAVVKLAGGDVVIGGAFGQVKGEPRQRLARLGADGQLSSFSVQIGGGDVHAIAEQADGKIVIGGSFTSVNGDDATRIARLNENGSLDTSFSPPGSTTTVWVQTHAWKWWEGYWTTVSTKGFDGTVYSIDVLDDGRILVGGAFTSYGGTAQTALALLGQDAMLDPAVSAANGNIPGSGSVYDAFVHPSGKIYYCGSFDSHIMRLNADFSLDGEFSTDIDGTVRSIALLESGNVLVGGNFTSVGGSQRGSVATIDGDGALHEAFDTTEGAAGVVKQVVALTGDKAVVMGAFNAFAGQPRDGAVCLNPDGSIDAAFGNSGLDVNSINSTD